ncbi:MAG: hypothetical protein ABIG42_04850 [bacterium]
MEDVLCNSCQRFFVAHDLSLLDCDEEGKPICPGCASEESELREMDFENGDINEPSEDVTDEG